MFVLLDRFVGWSYRFIFLLGLRNWFDFRRFGSHSVLKLCAGHCCLLCRLGQLHLVLAGTVLFVHQRRVVLDLRSRLYICVIGRICVFSLLSWHRVESGCPMCRMSVGHVHQFVWLRNVRAVLNWPVQLCVWNQRWADRVSTVPSRLIHAKQRCDLMHHVPARLSTDVARQR